VWSKESGNTYTSEYGYQNSTTELKWTEPIGTIKAEKLTAGTYVNGGGFQAVATDTRYIRLSTVSGDYSSKGTNYALEAALEAKGNLWLKDGNVFADNSYSYGWAPAVKAFGTINYNSSGTANQNNALYYSVSNSFNMNLTGGPSTYGVTISSSILSVYFINEVGTNYTVTLTPKFGPATNGWTGTLQIVSKLSTGFSVRIHDLNTNLVTLGANGQSGTYIDFQVTAL
jgi:hypothetical protein